MQQQKDTTTPSTEDTVNYELRSDERNEKTTNLESRNRSSLAD